MPLDDEMITDLQLWRMETPYADQDDWVFASFRKKGRQPLWPEALMRNHIRPAAARSGINKHISWHVFRHSFSNLLIANGEDVKTVQSLMRHANSRITLDIYSHRITESSDMLLYLAGVNEHAVLRIVGSKRWSVAQVLRTIQYLFEYGVCFLAT